MIKYIKGNLFASNPKLIVHGCNAQNIMGSGFALQIKQRYPDCFISYKNSILKLGENHIWTSQDNSVTIINAITQNLFGSTGAKFVKYDAVDQCMQHLSVDFTHVELISMPKIGAGLGGGDWNVIEAIINHRLKDHMVHVYEL